MRAWLRRAGVALLLGLCFGSCSRPGRRGPVDRATVADVAAAARPAVVRLRARGGMAQGSGAGFLVRGENGGPLIVSSRHVIWGADSVTVDTDDGVSEPAEVIGVDPTTDLALLRFRSHRNAERFLIFGDDKAMRVGDWLVSIGSPNGVFNAVSVGILSARAKVPHATLAAQSFVEYLFTDGAAGAGNSGGPILDLAGRVVGVNAAKLEGRGTLGIAIPAGLVQGVVAALERDGECLHSYAGVRVTDGQRGGADAAVIVTWSDTGGEPNGLRTGDRILRIDGMPVSTAREFEWREFIAQPGTRWTLDLIRDGARLTGFVVLRRLTQEAFLAEENRMTTRPKVNSSE